MTLDMLKVSPRVSAMARDLKARFMQLGLGLDEARGLLQARAADWPAIAELARDARRRLPRPLEPLDLRGPAGPLAPDHVVIATDGSQIEPDRHGPADYFLINVGWAVLRYGAEPYADLASEPTLYHEPRDTYIVHGERRVPIQDRHLSAKRAVEEIARAADLAAAWAPMAWPLAVLADGTLLQWVLEERPDDFLREQLLRPYVEHLARLRDLGVPVASYVSRPRSVEVATLLHEAICRQPSGGCAACERGLGEPCVFDRLPDRELFRFLAPGERSALFEVAVPRGLAEYYAGLEPRCFYLNVGSEIARVEVPPWTADDPERLALVQAVLLDQCAKGLGYPNVLARAHEQAVVTGQDRLAFEYLLDALLAREGVPARASEKLHSKRVRAV